MSCNRRFKVQLKRLTKISQSLFFRAALAGNIHVQALRNKPVAFAPDRGRKWTFHITILPYPSWVIYSPAREGIDYCGRSVDSLEAANPAVAITCPPLR